MEAGEAIPERRQPPGRRFSDQIDDLRDRQQALVERMDAHAIEMKENSRQTRETAERTERIERSTAQIVGLFEAASGFFRIVGLISDFGRKVAWLTIPFGLIAGGLRAAWKWLQAAGQ